MSGSRWVAANLAVAAALFAPSTANRVAAEPYAPAVGEPHPGFVLPSVADRAPVSLADFRGRKVLLIHFASW
jgi:hypothetical protein